MKPKLFIGSSRESVGIAYAIQQNLYRESEITVWSQGIFELSATTLDSLLGVVEASDLAVFIFSPDDIISIRGKENDAVRDNVIFELGLFIGRLGKRRCFIIMPDSNNNLRLPTDLLGVTPAMYETGRSDNNFQAATGPACNEIRSAIKKLGLISEEEFLPESPPLRIQKSEDESKDKLETEKVEIQAQQEGETDKDSWVNAFLAKEYEKAIQILETNLSQASEDKDRLHIQQWIGRVKASNDLNQGLEYIEALISKHPSEYDLYLDVANEYRWKDRYGECLATVERGLLAAEEKDPLINLKAQCLIEMGNADQALLLLQDAVRSSPHYENFYLTLAQLHVDTKDKKSAKDTLKSGLALNPNSEGLLSKLGELLESNSRDDLVLFVYHKLGSLFPKNPTYLSLLANSYLAHDLYGLSLEAYEQANVLAEEKQAWILGNIGNVYNNKGFHPKAIEYLKKALAIDADSAYAHERLSGAIKRNEEEQGKLGELLKSGRKAFYALGENEKLDQQDK